MLWDSGKPPKVNFHRASKHTQWEQVQIRLQICNLFRYVISFLHFSSLHVRCHGALSRQIWKKMDITRILYPEILIQHMSCLQWTLSSPMARYCANHSKRGSDLETYNVGQKLTLAGHFLTFGVKSKLSSWQLPLPFPSLLHPSIYPYTNNSGLGEWPSFFYSTVSSSKIPVQHTSNTAISLFYWETMALDALPPIDAHCAPCPTSEFQEFSDYDTPRELPSRQAIAAAPDYKGLSYLRSGDPPVTVRRTPCKVMSRAMWPFVLFMHKCMVSGKSIMNVVIWGKKNTGGQHTGAWDRASSRLLLPASLPNCALSSSVSRNITSWNESETYTPHPRTHTKLTSHACQQLHIYTK